MGIMMVFDITDINSYEDIATKWLPEIEYFTRKSTVKLLVGNKYDLISLREVSYERAEQFANKNGMLYIETSAKSGYNVEKVFELIARKIISKKTGSSKLLQKSLDKAKKKQETIPVRFLKLFFTGSGAAGKTSFINLLLKKKFVEHHHSTNVVHTNHAVSVNMATFRGSSDDKIEWIELDASLELSYLRSVLLPQGTIPTTTASQATPSKHANKNSSTDKIAPKPAKSKVFNQHTPPAPKFSIKQWFTNYIASSIKGSSLSTFDDIILSPNPRAVSHQPGEILNIITLLDTGGQPEYIHLLPTINIYPTVTFVIHDLSKGLSDQVLVEYSQHGKHVFKPYHLSYSNLDMIKLLMSAANDSVERPISNIPKLVTTPGSSGKSYVCLVGTHADKVSKQRMNEVENELNTLVHVTDCEAAVWQTENENILFSVNNATAGHPDAEDPVAKVIRKRIETLAEGKEIYNLPITWMLLQLEIQQICYKREKAYISFQDCVALARETGLMSKEKEVKSVLLYHHLLGVLIYFDEIPGLCDYVIVNHQWWFDKLSNIVCTTFQQAFLDQAVKKLKYQGLLSKELLQHVEWKDDIKEEFFLSLLVHMRIIAPVTTQKDKIEEYFIPYILPTYNLQQSNEILYQYGRLQGDPLLVQFRSGFLPRGLFCCLIVELLQHSPKGWEPHISCEKTHHSFSNVITFILPNGFFLSLLDKVSYLELQIRNLEKVTSGPVPVHVEVYNYLVYALTEVCIHLNFDYERLQYGFLCKCEKKPDNHIAIARLPTKSSEVLHARCIVNNAYQLKMDPSQLIWFYYKQNYSDHDHDRSEQSDVKVDSLAMAENDSTQPILKRPAMRLLHEIVVPRIAADWSIVADYLEYEVETKKLIREKCHHDPVKCCVELLEDWLSSNRGVSPKSWSRLIEALKGIKSLKATTEKIITDLEKAGVFV